MLFCQSQVTWQQQIKKRRARLKARVPSVSSARWILTLGWCLPDTNWFRTGPHHFIILYTFLRRHRNFIWKNKRVSSSVARVRKIRYTEIPNEVLKFFFLPFVSRRSSRSRGRWFLFRYLFFSHTSGNTSTMLEMNFEATVQTASSSRFSHFVRDIPALLDLSNFFPSILRCKKKETKRMNLNDTWFYFSNFVGAFQSLFHHLELWQCPKL